MQREANAVLTVARNFLELIKFEHTLFALPFAYVGMLLAARGWPTWHEALWITVAMAAARTVAMATNRLADLAFDRQNPRTAGRPLASGRVSPRVAWVGSAIALVILFAAAWQLGPLPLALLPAALVLLIGYAFTKRFTWLSHFVLGFTDGLAAAGAWVAVRGSLLSPGDVTAWLLVTAATFWIGGFDVIYACQDVESDRACGLHAIPVRFGTRAALTLSAISHIVATGFLIAVGVHESLGWPFAASVTASAGLLLLEHRLVRPSDLTRINVAFFHVNSAISFVLLLGVASAVLPQSGT